MTFRTVTSTVAILGPLVGPDHATLPWDGAGDLVLRRELRVATESPATSVFWSTAPPDPLSAASAFLRIGYAPVPVAAR